VDRRIDEFSPSIRSQHRAIDEEVDILNSRRGGSFLYEMLPKSRGDHVLRFILDEIHKGHTSEIIDHDESMFRVIPGFA